ncbi:hypothetical protein K435DRAFT_664315 [Dendrothele bispora CBS 962.96]|uniref:CxC1-like cysteine cluster associated with KDZ transposases domain-containing protein n=1 Tax=Dendrothele bispora (strain CBS 962.96) TaxID=1314807 RepID=A0A4V6T5F6_DENBC|nr:hypothetical protein K435DRAFT_664315 [Dendrothele bispora CBS 962.96]
MALLIRWHGRRWRKDTRSWKRRVGALDDNWLSLMDAMTDAYVDWKYKHSSSSSIPCNPQYNFNIPVIDIHTLEHEVFIKRDENTEPNVALVRSGYLGNSPLNPSLAISLRTLELFYVIRLFKPSFSVEAFSKVLCHVYGRPYRRGYRTSLSDAFDVYLKIRRKVDTRVASELGHDTPNYRVLNGCPACCYKLVGEPSLDITRMWVIDGNNSLKRIKGITGRVVSDTRVFTESDYYIPSEFVDKFAHEVKSRREDHDKTGSDGSEDEDDEQPKTDEGDPTDGPEMDAELQKILHGCTEKWKASAKDSHKKMWAIFKESSIFASACRHGFILWLVDMVESGELAKYPLAMVAKALEVFDDRWMLGYDIGCRFVSTIASTSLAPQFLTKKCRTCVNAFHGCAHNCLCQHKNLPLNIKGMGLEDLETLERVFSSSNQLASVTRYMSAYRRRVFIDMHFKQWDADKYQSLVQMLHNNYVQALTIIEEDGIVVKETLKDLNLTEKDLDDYFRDEVDHFQQKLGKEADDDVHAAVYVDLLQQYRDLNTSYENISDRFRTQIPQDYQPLTPEQQYNNALSQTRKIETERRVIWEQREKVLNELVAMEVSMGIEHRWTPASHQYQEALKYMTSRKYQQALETLYKLIIQRLFEMHRLNLNQTGYKMRTHISNALQKRSKAIQTAVRRYNTAALALDPPRPTLDWSKVSHFTFLDQFDILRETRHNVFNKPWAQPVIRETMKRHRRVLRAQEEIVRCNIELRRIHTSIVDEEKKFEKVLLHLSNSKNYGPVNEYILRRKAINSLLKDQLKRTSALPGFSGIPRPGTKLQPSGSQNTTSTNLPIKPSVAPVGMTDGSSSPAASIPVGDSTTSEQASEIMSDSSETKIFEDDEDWESVDEEDDEYTERTGTLVDFISNIPMHD